MSKKWFGSLLVAGALLASVALIAGCASGTASAASAPDGAQPVVLADVLSSNASHAPSSDAPATAQRISWASFQGAPNFHPGSGEGIWVWNENANGVNTLHVAATTEGLRHVFTGVLRIGPEGNFWDVDRSRLESDDHVSQAAYNELHFDFTTYNGVDAFSTEWSGRELLLQFRNDGVIRPRHVYYGANATPANGMPLLVDAGDEGLLTLPLSTLNGTTGFHRGAGEGYWIYSDASGIHLRTTTTGIADHKYYTGQIFGELANVSLYLPDDDWLKWPNGDHADFGLRANGGVDGIDLTLKGSSIVFTLRTDGHLAAPNIALGSNGFGLVHALTFRLQ